MITRRIAINVATFVVLSAVMVGLLFVSIFRVGDRYRIFATFADSGGVFTGQEVTYRGVTVGRVGEMTVVPEGVRIELVIEKRWDRIPRNAVARVMFKSAVGEQFIDLLPQTASGPYFSDGDTIPLERTQLPVQQEELLRLLDAVVEGIPPGDIGSLVTTVGTGLGGRGQDLRLALAALDPITAVLASRADVLNRLAVNADRVGAAFDRSARDFVQGAEGLAVVAEALGRGQRDLARVLEEGSRTAPELAALVAGRKQEIIRLIHDLGFLTRLSWERRRSVGDTIALLRPFLDTLVTAYDRGRRMFRFALVFNSQNPPCRYVDPATGQEIPTRASNDFSPKEPVVAFSCLGGQLPAAQGPPAPAGRAAGPAGGAPGPGGAAPSAPSGTVPAPLAPWLRLLADTLRGP